MTSKSASASTAASGDDSSRAVISRAARILRTLEAAPEGLTIAEITRASALPRTTVQRMVGSLQDEQLVAMNGTKVCLGPALARLAAAASRDVRQQLRPALEALSRQTGESVHLWTLRDQAAVLVDQVLAQQELQIVLPIGCTMPLANTAPGKAFIAQWNEDALQAALLQQKAAPTAPGHPDPKPAAEWLQDIRNIQRSGMAYDLEEHAQDVCALAATVPSTGPQAHAIAIALPLRRFQRDRQTLEAALRECVLGLAG